MDQAEWTRLLSEMRARRAAGLRPARPELLTALEAAIKALEALKEARDAVTLAREAMNKARN